MCLCFQWLLLVFPHAMMSDHVTQEDIDRMMIEGTVCFLLPVLEHVSRPWTLIRAHVNEFFEIGSARSWEDHDQPKWTSIVWTTQVTPACNLIERDTAPPPYAKWYVVLAQDEDKDKEDDDEAISCQSEGDCDWFSYKEVNTPSNEEELLWDITEAIRVQGPLKDEDWSVKVKNLFKEKGDVA